jgi:2-keto-3-deoxy-L-fuconate dehydrogenase
MTALTGSRVVVVTGSEGGVGAEACKAFRDLGDLVISVDVELGVDIRSLEQCLALADQVIATHGRVDVLCNNAGTGAVGDVITTTPEQWQSVLDVNVLGTVHMTRAFLPQMRAQRSGAIVNTCSIAAGIGLTDRVAYSASKGAVLAMTRAIAADEVKHGIRVNCVSPATVDGPWVRRLIDQSPDPEIAWKALVARQPMGKLVEPGAVAAAIVYLADSGTAMTGCELRIDGGATGLLGASGA